MKLFAIVAQALVAALSVSCSDANVADLAEQAQAATQTYSATNTNMNGTVNTQYAAGKFCHSISFSGAGAHGQARVMNFGIPATGGIVEHYWPAAQLVANPDLSGYTAAPSGTMSATFDCQMFSDFTGAVNAPGLSGNDDIRLDWGVTATATSVNGTRMGWDGVSACWIDGLGHMNHGGKLIELVGVPSNNPGGAGWSWQLHASGYAALDAAARCAYLGKTITATAYHATPGNPAVAVGYRPNNSTCFINRIVGVLDDGFVQWKRNFYWQLEVGPAPGVPPGSGVTEANGYCVAF